MPTGRHTSSVHITRRGAATWWQGDDVIAWRQHQLVEAGFGPELAAVVAADPRWDVHAVLELVERGCPPRLATRILAPHEQDGVSS